MKTDGEQKQHGIVMAPERIWTVGGNDGHFFTRQGNFAQVEYVRGDLYTVLREQLVETERERDSTNRVLEMTRQNRNEVNRQRLDLESRLAQVTQERERLQMFVAKAAGDGCLRGRLIHCVENEPNPADWCIPCQAKALCEAK